VQMSVRRNCGELRTFRNCANVGTAQILRTAQMSALCASNGTNEHLIILKNKRNVWGTLPHEDKRISIFYILIRHSMLSKLFSLHL